MTLSEKTIEHTEFGEIQLIKSSRAKRVNISIRPFENVKVTIPSFTGFIKAEKFIAQKESWIRKNLLKVRGLEERYTIFDEGTEYSTKEHGLEILRFDEARTRVVLRDKKIEVKIPRNADLSAPGIQEMIRWGIQAAWRKEAKKYLPQRLRELAVKHRLEYNKVFIKNNRSRWGSCSEKNNINLSLHLMRLPDHLVDYILLHELTHTVHKNHGKNFWKELERLCGNAKAMDKELHAFRIDIY